MFSHYTTSTCEDWQYVSDVVDKRTWTQRYITEYMKRWNHYSIRLRAQTSSCVPTPAEWPCEGLQEPGSSNSRAGPWCGRRGRRPAASSSPVRRLHRRWSTSKAAATWRRQLSQRSSTRCQPPSAPPCEPHRTPRSYSSLHQQTPSRQTGYKFLICLLSSISSMNQCEWHSIA